MREITGSLERLQVLGVDVHDLHALENFILNQEPKEAFVQHPIPKDQDQQVLSPSKLHQLPEAAHIADFLLLRHLDHHLHCHEAAASFVSELDHGLSVVVLCGFVATEILSHELASRKRRQLVEEVVIVH